MCVLIVNKKNRENELKSGTLRQRASPAAILNFGSPSASPKRNRAPPQRHSPMGVVALEFLVKR